MYLEKFRLDGKIAVITGAGRGIGFATAEALSEAGATVIITDMDEAAADAARDALIARGRKRGERQARRQRSARGGKRLRRAHQGAWESGHSRQQCRHRHLVRAGRNHGRCELD